MSVEHLEQLVRSHGYWALLVGTLFEGETVLMIGGLCAKIKLLNLPVVMAVAFVGSFTGDQICFFAGYFKGRQILSKHPRWERRTDKVHRAIRKYRTLIMLGFRFVYGMRMMTPFVIGLDRQIKVRRFAILNAIGAAAWSVAVATGGYCFGYALQGFVNSVRRYEVHAILIVCAVGMCLWAFHRLRNRQPAAGTSNNLLSWRRMAHRVFSFPVAFDTADAL